MLTRNDIRIALIALVLPGTNLANAQVQFPWPVTPFDQSQEITGNFAEYRSTSTNGHFHNGTDIPKPDGSPVYPVKDGIVTSLERAGSNAFVRVQDVAYVHIAPAPSLSIGDSVFASQTVLGTILPGMGHVHFTNGFVGSEKNSMLVNSGLTPYEDPWPPIIRSVRFFQNNTGNEFQTNKLSGLVDIMVKVDEQNGPPPSNTARRNNGTYKIGYKIFNADTTEVVFEPPNNGLRFQLDTKPSNSYVNIVYYKPLSSTTSHTYQVTNDINRDNFWNTAMLPVGDYLVMAFTEDTRGNTDTAFVAVSTTESDLTPPQQPVLKHVKEGDNAIALGWFPNTDEDLAGYRLFFSFDNETWNLFRDQTVLTPNVTDTTISGTINRDAYFRLTAVDDAPVPNESVHSDIYGMSNGQSFLGKVLIVDGFDRTDGGWREPFHHFVFTHGRAIIANQFSFDTVPNEAIEDSLTYLNDYDAVFWILGDESTVDETFSAREQCLVSDYLAKGGSLFVSGSEVAWDLDQNSGSGAAGPEDEAFLNDFLKTEFISNNAETGSVSGAAGSIFEGLSFNFGQIPYPVPEPDVIAPTSGAIPCLEYDGGQIAGVQYAGTFGESETDGKLVYLAFPFETIAQESVRDELLGRVFEFFFTITSVDSEQKNSLPTEFSLSQNYPNPFNPETSIQYYIPVTSVVSIKIFNSLGQTVRTLINGIVDAGVHKTVWDGRDDSNNPVTSGVYLVKLRAENKTRDKEYQETRRVVLLR